MDTHLLLIFLFTSCWLYVALLLAILDWRWNLGRIVLFSVCAGIGVWAMLTHHLQPNWTTAVGALFGVTVLGPFLLQRLVIKLVLAGRTAAARFFHGLLRLVVWPSADAAFEALLRVRAHMADATGPRVSRHLHRQMLGRIYAAGSRRASLTGRIEACTYLHKYSDAVEIFQKHLGDAGLKPSASLLYTMAITHSELGNLAEGVRCLGRAEEMDDAKHPRDLRRFLALLRIFTQSGRVEQLENHLRRFPGLVAQLSSAYLYLARGVALLRSGRKDEARDALNQAAIHLRPHEQYLRRRIQERLAEASEPGPTLAPDPDTQDELDALESILERQPTSPAFMAREPSSDVTLALVMVCVAVWSLTEVFGSSENARTLLRFGANMPDLVRNGEWWRLVSSIFLHAGWLHLFFNAYACYLFGSFVERVSGRSAIFAVFMISGLCGSAASAFLGHYRISVGASGAVFGLLGAAIVLVMRLKTAFSLHVRKVYVFNFLFIAAINTAYGLVETRIDNLAHGGGFAAGVGMGLLLAPLDTGKIRNKLVRAVGAVMLVVLALAAFLTTQNVRTGGYPTRIPPMEEYVSPRGTWSAEIPVFWEIEDESPGMTALAGPLGARLMIGYGDLPPQAGRELTRALREDRASGTSAETRRGKELIPEVVPCPVAIITVGEKRFRRTAGRYVMHDEAYVLVLLEPDEADEPYILIFRCALKGSKAYEGLLRQILWSLRFRSDAPREEVPDLSEPQ